jgi:hypothetical protein
MTQSDRLHVYSCIDCEGDFYLDTDGRVLNHPLCGPWYNILKRCRACKAVHERERTSVLITPRGVVTVRTSGTGSEFKP